MRWLALFFLSGCTDLVPDARDVIGPLPDHVPAPANNPTTPEAVELGRLLFWDPILSGSRDVACASCHHPDHAYGDGLPVSLGVAGAPALRNSPTLLATGFNGFTSEGDVPPEQAPMFWDHRVESLELQALEPIKSQVEMRGPGYTQDEILPEVVARLAANAEYATHFQAAFGAEGVSISTTSRAIAAFERTLVPSGSSFDRYMAGDDDAMSPEQIRGLHGFISQGCSRCHSGPMLSDYKLHEITVGGPDDLGNGKRQFRTPSLRMVTLTAPYMHDGSLATLDEVFDLYHNIDVTDPLLEGDVEVALGAADDTLLFFAALSDGTFDRTIPDRVPSGLPPGGVR